MSCACLLIYILSSSETQEMAGTLLQSGVSCVQLVGSMSMAARDAAIKKFTEDPDCRIFLMSLKAGGVALNLTVASHVSHRFLFLMRLLYHSPGLGH